VRGDARRQLTLSGGQSGGETPLPIPNRAVKPASADGTRRVTSRESRSPPVFSPKGRLARPFLVCGLRLHAHDAAFSHARAYDERRALIPVLRARTPSAVGAHRLGRSPRRPQESDARVAPRNAYPLTVSNLLCSAGSRRPQRSRRHESYCVARTASSTTRPPAAAPATPDRALAAVSLAPQPADGWRTSRRDRRARTD
jgi:hypothetical protein